MTRVLIVDDQRLNVQLLTDILKDHYDLAIASDGERAIEICERKPPDLVLLDVQMPGMDGYETCRRLKANSATREIPVIFVTARDSVDDQIKGLDAGAVDFITKPVHAPIVRARTRTQLPGSAPFMSVPSPRGRPRAAGAAPGSSSRASSPR